MAIGWLTVLQNMPWSEVISGAPKVADAAKKLWNGVAKKPAVAHPAPPAPVPAASPEAQAIADLQARVSVLEAAAAELHQQMLASSELIKALAEQNAQLIRGIEIHRVRLRWLGAATVASAVAALVGLALAIGSHSA